MSFGSLPVPLSLLVWFLTNEASNSCAVFVTDDIRFTFCQFPFILSAVVKKAILQRDSEQQMISMARVRGHSSKVTHVLPPWPHLYSHTYRKQKLIGHTSNKSKLFRFIYLYSTSGNLNCPKALNRAQGRNPIEQEFRPPVYRSRPICKLLAPLCVGCLLEWLTVSNREARRRMERHVQLFNFQLLSEWPPPPRKVQPMAPSHPSKDFRLLFSELASLMGLFLCSHWSSPSPNSWMLSNWVVGLTSLMGEEFSPSAISSFLLLLFCVQRWSGRQEKQNKT